ncbi:MAG: hypothetical protein ACK40D_12145 [Cyanobacteriota bacterium]
MRVPPEHGVHLKAAALLTQPQVHRPHKIIRDLLGKVFRGDHHGGGALLQSTEQIDPEIHELALPPRLQTLLFEVGGTALAIPERWPGRAAVAAMGQARAQGLRAGASIELAQASGLE